jgi:hypothetical protein
LEDLSAINYRLQGLAEKKPETQETMLVKRIKYRVRSIKVLGWIGSKESNRSRGFSRKRTRHKKQSTYYNFLLTERSGANRGAAAALVASGAGAPAS